MIEYTKEFYNNHNKWILDNGDKTHRLEYDLNSDSIVLDIGGYKGTWSDDIYRLYNCNIYIFEPVRIYYKEIKEKFKLNDKIKVFNYGLGGITRNEFIDISGDSSTIYGIGNEEILIRNVLEVLDELKIDKIDLCKQNLEGGEYELMNVLGDSNRINDIKNLQIQFHKINEIPNCVEMRDSIIEKLLKTHNLSYHYEWVWSGFKIK